jgi:acyl-coenzyme A thioesterase PaaI-like protein
VDDARGRAAAEVRGLIHALVGHEAEGAVLEHVAATAARLREYLERGTLRRRPADGMRDDLSQPVPADGERVNHFADCPISGEANPLSSALTAHRDGDGVVCTAELGPAYEGAPGRAHGGAVAALFDDAFGFATQVADVPSYAGELTVRFVRPTPIGQPLRIRARAVRQVGRRLYLEGTMDHHGTVVATATSINISVDRERLGRARYD